MKKILSTTAIVGSLCLLGSNAIADSKAFQGAHIGVSGSVFGAEFKGKRVGTADASTPADTTKLTTNGSAGFVGGLADLDIGYTATLDKNSAITIGARYIPVKADVSASSSDSGDSGKAELKNIYGLYLKPTYIVSKDAAVYAGLHYMKGDLNVTGLSATGSAKPGDLEGWGGSVGLRVNLTQNAFLNVEASYTEFDGLTVKDVAKGKATTKTYTFDPYLAEGRVTLGFKF